MQKFIHTDFEIDLSDTKINEQEESTFFKDKFFSKFTLPFELELTDELNMIFGNISSNNSTEYKTYFEGYYYHFGIYEKAVLEVEELQSQKISASIRWGIEELSNHNKKLSELPLENFDLNNQTIYAYANSIVNKAYPETTHNFPAIYNKLFKESGDDWDAFKGFMNNYNGVGFVENVFDQGNSDLQLKNMMQPMPYLFHVLEKGFQDAGFAVEGDFMANDTMKKILMVTQSDFYSNIVQPSNEFQLYTNEYQSIYEDYPNDNYGYYEKTIPITEPGRYKIAGNITVRKIEALGVGNILGMAIRQYQGNNNFESLGMVYLSGLNSGYEEHMESININVDVFDVSKYIQIEGVTSVFAKADGQFIDDAIIADLTVTQLVRFSNNQPDPDLNMPKKIDLTTCVPEITFGQLLTVLKNWFNLDITPKQNTISIDYIPIVTKNAEIVDLSDVEVRGKTRHFNRGKSFLYSFEEIKNDDYENKKIFVDRNGMSTDSSKKNDDTEEILVEGLPLPVTQKKDKLTADLFHDSKDVVNFVIYSGLNGSNQNWTQNPLPISLVTSYEKYWKDWLDFRIRALSEGWTIIIDEHRAKEIKIKKRIYAFRRIHLIKSLAKNKLYRDMWEVEIETET